jgi:Domain of unknown function (DUF4270)
MQRKHTAFAALLFVLIAFWSACTQPTPFGADLLQDQLADYEFTDTLTLNCTLQREDSVITSDPRSTVAYFLCGDLQDPEFGKTTAETFALFGPASAMPNLKTVQIDSMVLYLNVVAPGAYGDTTQTFSARVFRLDERLDDSTTYYSTSKLRAGEEVGSLLNFQPKTGRRDSLYATGTTRGAFIRIPLSRRFAGEIAVLDSLDRTDIFRFYRAVRGLKIVVTPDNLTPGALLSFNLNSDAFSVIRLYYTLDGKKNAQNFTFRGNNKFTRFVHDYTGSSAGQSLGKPNNDRLYLQGTQGVRVKVDFKNAPQLKNIAVNKAELVLTAVPPANAFLAPATQLEASSDTAKRILTDVLFSLGPNLTGGFTAFGGKPVKETVNGKEIQRYRMTLTQHFQSIVDYTGQDPEKRSIYLNVYPQGTVRHTLIVSPSAMRTVLYGPKSAEFPAKLELKYTKIR